MKGLTEAHKELFGQWSGEDVGMGFHFKALEARTGMSRDKIRPMVRDLAEAGFLLFTRGCFTEEGDPYGSAYVLTTAGRTALRAMEKQP